MIINAYAERLSAARILSLIGWSRTYSTLIFVLYSVILTAVSMTFSVFSFVRVGHIIHIVMLL